MQALSSDNGLTPEAPSSRTVAEGALDKPDRSSIATDAASLRPTQAAATHGGWEGEVYLGVGEFSTHLTKHLTSYPTRQNQLLPYFHEARSLRWLARGALLDRSVNLPSSMWSSLA